MASIVPRPRRIGRTRPAVSPVRDAGHGGCDGRGRAGWDGRRAGYDDARPTVVVGRASSYGWDQPWKRGKALAPA